MQRLSRNLAECLRSAAARVGAPSGGLSLHGLATGAAPAPLARWASSAAVSGSSSSASAPRASLVLHQKQKKELRPENSGRNAFRRAWAKRLQIKWNAQERKAKTKVSRQLQHEKRLEQYKQRSQWATEQQQQQAGAV